MKKPAAKKPYTAKDMRDVSDSPIWTKEDFAEAKPFDEVFPKIRRGRGPNKAPTKEQVTLRLSPYVIKHFRAGGPGWQSRIDETLAKAIKKRKAG
ncbi:BrnA antitoxin family protein [Bradyrhizobium jicamae]|uniref:BrnA antitoxin family protein n=1 Tax=Bradyrhizobium jicamae TaxID=280332 RepID=A0ABS5FDE8_9BRAD|nr:BrnA antitoxin family protein [Bradyrhizobium jicamae]MBR0794811.1 BrnA antitoxin family protein [Bradyrhizobium jicamae]MBR0938802.1 BrnA antitoxin family protein [Bradyrhizobium jicamae]